MKYPENCPFCGTERLGIQERRVAFKCGTSLLFANDPPSGKRSAKCVIGERDREKKEAE